MAPKLLGGLVLLLVPVLALSGCSGGVSEGEYDAAIAQRDAAQAQVNTMQELQIELDATRIQLEATEAKLEEVEQELQLYKDTGIQVYSGVQPYYAKTLSSAERSQVVLANNSAASDPTWYQLQDFLFTDTTDEETYSLASFACGAFAEQLHNNAEAASIRAAWVAIEFEEGVPHALNAFRTLDRGLVYIDCTGGSIHELVPLSESGAKVYGVGTSWDRVAYVTVGREYGIIGLDVASCPEYVCYEEHTQRKTDFDTALEGYNQEIEAFNLEVERHNEWIAGKVFIEGTTEARRAQDWFEELEQEKQNLEIMAQALDRTANALGAFWKPLGTVSKVDIYW
jgi:hypothetical protein